MTKLKLVMSKKITSPLKSVKVQNTSSAFDKHERLVLR